MALPVLNNETHTIKVPSQKRTVDFRPFLVKEEKILMIVQESKDSKKILKVIKDIISACSFNKLDPNTLTSTDLEYIFLQLRATSVGETTSINIKCNNCEEYTTNKINIKDIDVVEGEVLDNNIKITDGVGIILKSISLTEAEKIDTTNTEKSFNQTLIYSIESIYDADNVYPASEHTEKEMIEFIDSLSHKHLEKIQNYIQNVPKLQHTCSFKCKECETENVHVLEGIESFFS